MTQKDNGGPAFPADNTANVNDTMGMTLRDFFAGQALAAMMDINPNLPYDRASSDYWPEPEDLAMRRALFAYIHADAMIAARKETQ